MRLSVRPDISAGSDDWAELKTGRSHGSDRLDPTNTAASHRQRKPPFAKTLATYRPQLARLRPMGS